MYYIKRHEKRWEKDREDRTGQSPLLSRSMCKLRKKKKGEKIMPNKTKRLRKEWKQIIITSLCLNVNQIWKAEVGWIDELFVFEAHTEVSLQ